jgi:hypothetical protein
MSEIVGALSVAVFVALWYPAVIACAIIGLGLRVTDKLKGKR